MSIIITGIEMPENCCGCVCLDGENGECRATGSRDTWCSEPPRSCPIKSIDGLIEYLMKHSRVIDYSVLSGNSTLGMDLWEIEKYIKEYCEA